MRFLLYDDKKFSLVNLQSLYKTLLIAGISSVARRLTASEALILKHASVHVAIILL